jgi:drug/metabolite transporter (DMT)-like permease
MNGRAVLQALLAAVLFGIATPFSKLLLADLQANQLAGLLYLGAGACMLPWVLGRRRSGSVIFPRDDRNRLLLLGAVFFGGIAGPVLLLVGLKVAQAASVSMWLNLEAVATTVLALLFFRENIGRRTWIANAGVVVAGVLLSYDAGWAGWLGLLCVAGASVAWGLDNNFTALIDGISPEDSTFWKGLIAGSCNLAIGLTLFTWPTGWDWLWALALGMAAYGLSVTLYIRSAHGLGAARAQMIFAASPFFGVLLSVLWLHETLTRLQAAAALVLAGSIILLFRDRHAHAHEHVRTTHEHVHRHDDGHHGHAHIPPAEGKHTHVHTHEPMVHRHPHWPDLHHRHAH